ncbi:hypothetical protein [Arcticibacter svalbardensis]|uniref:hypothetical protein n=1 Tax=Arcticibacter svalbardensis TaxID=1288027 RepID=UPI00039D34CF|nr:hypothetical protein [Arcticibacter svalbardensis]
MKGTDLCITPSVQEGSVNSVIILAKRNTTDLQDPPAGVARPEYDMILRMRPTVYANTKLSTQKL